MYTMESGGTARSMAVVDILSLMKTSTKESLQKATAVGRESMPGLTAVSMKESGKRIK